MILACVDVFFLRVPFVVLGARYLLIYTSPNTEPYHMSSKLRLWVVEVGIEVGVRMSHPQPILSSKIEILRLD